MSLPFLPFRRPRRSKAHGRAACLILAAAACSVLAQPVHAQQVTGTFTQGGGFFNYNFTVNNNTAFELFQVDIVLPTVPNTTALTTGGGAPTGFQTTVDNGQDNGTTRTNGFVDFSPLSDPTKGFFMGTSVSGFLVRSPIQFNGLRFEALNSQSNTVTGTVVTTAAPEPGTLGLLAFGAGPAAGALVAFRRRRLSSASLKG